MKTIKRAALLLAAFEILSPSGLRAQDTSGSRTYLRLATDLPYSTDTELRMHPSVGEIQLNYSKGRKATCLGTSVIQIAGQKANLAVLATSHCFFDKPAEKGKPAQKLVSATFVIPAGASNPVQDGSYKITAFAIHIEGYNTNGLPRIDNIAFAQIKPHDKIVYPKPSVIDPRPPSVGDNGEFQSAQLHFRNCEIIDADETFFVTNCVGMGGNSGGAYWKNGRIAGVVTHVGIDEEFSRIKSEEAKQKFGKDIKLEWGPLRFAKIPNVAFPEFPKNGLTSNWRPYGSYVIRSLKH